MRVLSFLLMCIALAPGPAQSQAVVEHFVGPEGGPGFRDGVGTAARFYSPGGVWADGSNLYIADTGNAVIRKMALATGEVTTFAGRPQEYDIFNGPRALWGDGTSLYVTDGFVIRKVDLATGTVSLFVDTWNEPPLITPRGFVPPRPYALTGTSTNLYVFYSASTSLTLLPIGVPAIREISRSSGAARTLPYSAHGGAMPSGLWADEHFLYLSYAGNSSGVSLGRMNLSTSEFEPLFGFPIVPILSPIPPGPPSPASNLWGDNAGHLFFTNSNTVYQVELASGAVTFVVSVPTPSPAGTSVGGMWGAGALLFGTNSLSNTVFRVDTARKYASTFAGAAPKAVAVEPPPSSTLYGVRSIWSDGSFVYAADSIGEVIRKIDAGSGQSSVFLSNIKDAVGLWGDASDLYISRIAERNITRVSWTTGETSVLASGFFFPAALAGDADSLYVEDNYAIRRVSKTTGAVTTLAGQSLNPGYANGTGTSARFSGIRAMWSSGTVLYAADEGRVRNIVIATGEVGTFAENFGQLSALAGDGAYLYVGASSTIRRITLSTAEVTTIAGSPSQFIPEDGTGQEAHFGYIQGLWTDGRVAYAADGRIRKLDLATRAVTTIAGRNVVLSQGVFPADQFISQSLAGNANFIYAIDGYGLYKISPRIREITHLAGAFNEPGSADGPADKARFYSPSIIWSDERYVYIDDYINLKIRKVDTETGAVTPFMSGMSARIGWGDGRYLYVVDEYDPNKSIYRIDPSTAQKTLLATGFRVPTGMWGDAQSLYLAEAYQCVIKKVSLSTGAITILAGHSENCKRPDVKTPPADGTGANAFFPDLGAITGDGRLLYVIDSTTVRTVDPQTGETHTIAGKYPIAGNENGVGSDAHFFRTRDGKSSIWSDGTNLYVAQGTIRRVVLARPLSSVQFDFGATGGDYWKTAQTPAALRVGYGRLHTNAGSSMPGAVAIFSYRPNGVLVSEASVPASPPVQDGRIYVDVNGPVNTGIAIANPNSQPALISFYFTDASGANFGAGTTTIVPNSQVAAFFDEVPFRPADSPGSVAQARSFTFSSSLPVGVIALRGYVNERSEFLMTTLPVAPTSSSSAAPILLPHFADGGGWRTQVLLVNPTDRFMSGMLTMDSAVSYSIAPRASVNIASSGVGTAVRTGAVRITPSPLSLSPVASTVFSFRQSGIVVTESGVATSGTSRSFRLFAETGAVRTGLAFMNASAAPGVLHFTLLDFDGRQVASSDPLSIAAGERLSMFIHELPGFTNLPWDFRGVLRISADVPISVVGLRGYYNERGEFLIATTPALPEDSPAIPGESIFPHIVTGAGYTTEFLLLSGGGSASGNVDFVSQSGESMTLPIQR
jgi:sugar lactone lactonase YvrE